MRLGTYKHLKIHKPEVTVSDHDIYNVLHKQQRINSIYRTIDGRPAQNGDRILIDMSGTIDGVPIHTGPSRDFPLILGSHAFISGFEESLVGHRVGDVIALDIHYPDDYRKSEYAGQTIHFTITIKKIGTLELQPFDDDFARDFSEYQTLHEWEDAIRQELLDDRRQKAREETEKELLAQIIASSDIPVDGSLLQAVSKEMFDEFLYNIRAYHMELDEYCKRTGQSQEQIHQKYDTEARTVIQDQIVLHLIAEQEQLAVTEDELQHELSEIVKDEEWEPDADDEDSIDAFRRSLDPEELESIKDDIIMDKAMDFVVRCADFTE